MSIELLQCCGREVKGVRVGGRRFGRLLPMSLVSQSLLYRSLFPPPLHFISTPQPYQNRKPLPNRPIPHSPSIEDKFAVLTNLPLRQPPLPHTPNIFLKNPTTHHRIPQNIIHNVVSTPRYSLKCITSVKKAVRTPTISSSMVS